MKKKNCNQEKSDSFFTGCVVGITILVCVLVCVIVTCHLGSKVTDYLNTLETNDKILLEFKKDAEMCSDLYSSKSHYTQTQINEDLIDYINCLRRWTRTKKKD